MNTERVRNVNVRIAAKVSILPPGLRRWLAVFFTALAGAEAGSYLTWWLAHN